MKVNFNTVMTDLDGKPIVENGKELTLKFMCANALLINEDISGDEKLQRFELAHAIHNDAKEDLLPEEAALIKKLIGKGFVPLVVGQAFKILNGE